MISPHRTQDVGGRVGDAGKPKAKTRRERRTAAKVAEGSLRGETFLWCSRLTVRVRASILTWCFAPTMPRVVACVHRHVGREQTKFLPTHPAARVGFVSTRSSSALSTPAGQVLPLRAIEFTRRRI